MYCAPAGIPKTNTAESWIRRARRVHNVFVQSGQRGGPKYKTYLRVATHITNNSITVEWYSFFRRLPLSPCVNALWWIAAHFPACWNNAHTNRTTNAQRWRLKYSLIVANAHPLGCCVSAVFYIIYVCSAALSFLHALARSLCWRFSASTHAWVCVGETNICERINLRAE